MAKVLHSADDVIDALGGTGETAKIVGLSPQAVSNWRTAKRLPPETFLILSEELKRLDTAAPPSLWGIKEPVT